MASRAYEEKTEGGDLYSVKLSEELKQELHEAGNEAVCGEVTRIPMEWVDTSDHVTIRAVFTNRKTLLVLNR